MDINRASMDLFFQDLKVEYTDGFNSGMEKSVLERIAMRVTSTSASTVHGWLNQIPKMREWIGDRQVKNIESAKLEITNRKFESTIEIPREDLEDDSHGLYRPIARIMGQNAAVFPDELCVDALIANANWADGAAFFGDSRLFGANTIDNYTTDALAEGSFETAYTAMTSYLGHNNEPLGVVPEFLLYGPSLRDEAFDLLTNEFRATQASNGVPTKNRNKGLVTPILSQRLVGANASKWALLGTIAGLKPIAYQERLAPEIQSSRLSNDSDYVFETDKYQFGVRARGAAFLTLPMLAYYGNV